MLLYSWRIANAEFKRQKSKGKTGNYKLVMLPMEQVLEGEKVMVTVEKMLPEHSRTRKQ